MCRKAKATVGTPASSPPTSGNRSTRATHTPKTTANGTPSTSRVTMHTMPAMNDVAALPTT